jgi:hypothetical protein
MLQRPVRWEGEEPGDDEKQVITGPVVDISGDDPRSDKGRSSLPQSTTSESESRRQSGGVPHLRHIRARSANLLSSAAAVMEPVLLAVDRGHLGVAYKPR